MEMFGITCYLILNLFFSLPSTSFNLLQDSKHKSAREGFLWTIEEKASSKISTQIPV